MLLCSLCLSFVAPSSGAETIDHFHPSWRGSNWISNQLRLPLAHQAAFYPLITQGTGNLALPDGAFILRFPFCALSPGKNEKLLTVWGRVADPSDTALATLYFRGNRLVWASPSPRDRDSLFDSPAIVELETDLIATNRWLTFDVLIDPRPFQQTFGWNRLRNTPADPKHKASGRTYIARQLSAAAWTFNRLEMHRMTNCWFGQLELLPNDTTPNTLPLNILAPATLRSSPLAIK